MKLFCLLSRSMSRSDIEMCGLSFSRWWSHSRLSVTLVFFMAVILPYVYSDDPHVLPEAKDGTIYSIAKINISYLDPEKKKETTATFKGKFGMNSIVISVSGTLVHAVSESRDKSKGRKLNHYGCTKYANNHFPSENWISLVERGECVFTTKIRIATKEYNASAVIIYNNDSTVGETIMDHRPLSSVSVFIDRNDGKRIASILERNIKVHLHLWPDGTARLDDNMHNSISKTSVLFVSISFIVLMIISLAWLVFYYIQRFRYSHAKERLARRLACAAKKAIAKTPQKTVKVGDKELEPEFDQCAVCIEPYKAHDVIRILPCRHVFHKSCVDPWLLDQRSCPMCKLDILRAYGMQIGGSQESVHPDPESGPAANLVQEEPEVSSSAEDTQTDEIKVLLVPHTCLHFHGGQDKTEGEEEATSLLGADGGTISSSSSGSFHSKGSSHSRAEKADLAESGSSEMKALIGKERGEKKRRKSKEKVENDEEDEEKFGKNDFKITSDAKKSLQKGLSDRQESSSSGVAPSSSSGDIQKQVMASSSSEKSGSEEKKMEEQMKMNDMPKDILEDDSRASSQGADTPTVLVKGDQIAPPESEA